MNYMKINRRVIYIGLAVVLGCGMSAGRLFSAPEKGSSKPPATGVTAPPKDVVESLKLDPFYKKYVSACGMAIVGSDKVSDYALLEAAYLINQMLKDRPDICKAMIANKSRVAIMGAGEFTTDIPEHRKLKPKGYWDYRARGLGARLHRPATTCGQENLLRYKGDPYITENILIHEFAHGMHFLGLKFVDKKFDEKLQKAYNNAMKKGLWADKYAGSNPIEYWAEAVQSWFDTNRQPDRSHNHVDTRKELKEYDPEIAKLVAEVFGDKPWKYVRPSKRKEPGHLKGYDRSKAPAFSWPKRVLQAWEDLDRSQDVDGEQ